MSCAYHLTNRAVVQCSRCGRPLCPACDHRIRGFPYCQDCIVTGVELLQHQQTRPGTSQFVRRKTSAFVALLLSFVCPGLGAAYNGQTSKALVHFTIFASFFQMATVTDGTAFFVLGVIGTWLFAAVDAVRTAQLIRAGLAPDAEQDAIARRLYGNPLAWAVTMMTLGTVFLLHTLFGVQVPGRFGGILALIALLIVLVKQLIALIGFIMFAVKIIIVIAFIGLMLLIVITFLSTRRKRRREAEEL